VHDVLFETHPQYFGAGFVRMARWSARRAVRRARLTLTVSEYSRREIARHYHIDAGRVILTPNAVDPQRFHPPAAGGPDADEAAILGRWGLRPGNYLCMLGRLEPRKNHASLVRAYARLGADAPPLVIVGQRDFAYESVFTLIQSLHLERRVSFLEDVDDEALPVVLRHARLMVYPSEAEGFGMPVLEALASGVPVITSNTTSLPEVAGDAAWLVQPGETGGLTLALQEALAEPPARTRERIGRGLQQAAKFNWHDAASNLLAAVRGALRATPMSGA
jgi:glycosyltransferase involved in cell wall biosynthesis